MNKYIYSFIISSFVLFAQGNAATSLGAVCDIPREELGKWKLAGQEVEKDTGMMVSKWIPKEDSLDSWSEMITFSLLKEKRVSVNQALSRLKKSANHSQNRVKWNVLKKSMNSATYEMVYDSPDEGFVYNIMHTYVKDDVVLNIGYAKKNSEPSLEERDGIISLLSGKIAGNVRSRKHPQLSRL